MHGEESGENKALRDGSRRPSEKQKDQQNVNRVKNHAAQVVASRCLPEELAIQHVAQPGNWVPVCCIAVRSSKSPGNPVACQTGQNMSILKNIIRVIVRDEIESDRPSKNQHRK